MGARSGGRTGAATQVCFSGSHSRERMVLEAQVQGFVARVNSKLGSIDEAGPVQFFLDINPFVSLFFRCVSFF